MGRELKKLNAEVTPTPQADPLTQAIDPIDSTFIDTTSDPELTALLDQFDDYDTMSPEDIAAAKQAYTDSRLLDEATNDWTDELNCRLDP
jgi:hypothetical protein